MKDSPFAGALLITAWWHDGTIIARFRGYHRLRDAPQDLGSASGPDAIMAKLSGWLQQAENDGAGDLFSTERQRGGDGTEVTMGESCADPRGPE